MHIPSYTLYKHNTPLYDSKIKWTIINRKKPNK